MDSDLRDASKVNARRNGNQHEKNSPQQPKQISNPTKLANKPRKRANRRRRPESKKVINEIFKTPPKDMAQKLPQPSTSRAPLNTGPSKPLAPTKVKSGSWKRSEKPNTLGQKKPNVLRKRSPQWLKFPSSPVSEKRNQFADTNSVCRPGTLYSDVLFAAGSSSLVKVKTLTPRCSGQAAQKKLTKALLKFSGGKNNETGTDDSDSEKIKGYIFPSLQQLPYAKTTAATKAASSYTEKAATLNNLPIAQTQADKNSDSPISCSPIQNEAYAGTNTLKFSNYSDQLTAGNQLSYGHYLDQQFEGLYVNPYPDLDQNVLHRLYTKFGIDLPQWNFTYVDIYSDSFPKFLRQFDDEQYMRAEKLSEDSLNLDMGFPMGRSIF